METHNHGLEQEVVMERRTDESQLMFTMNEVVQLCVCVSLALFITNEAVTVRRVFVPEDHSLLLSCDGQSDVRWRHGGERLMNVNSSKQKLFPDGMLCIDDVEMSDSGLYYCNDKLMAHVTVLTDYNVVVCEGATLYLRCMFPKQRWAFKQPTELKKVFISTRFKNGTVFKERPDPDSRFTHSSNHLQIRNIQRLDSGTYYCSGKDIAVVTVTSETTESGNNVPQKSGNVVLVAVLALCVLAVVTVVLLLVIMCLKFSSRKKPTASKPEERERPRLQETHSHDADAVTRLSADRLRSNNDEVSFSSLVLKIHYASLGRQNWKPRGWNQQSRQQVIYSTLLLTPKHTPTHTP